MLPDRGPGKDDILWRARHRSSPLWVFPDDATGNARTAARLRTPPGQPVVGDFDGNGLADVLFYDLCDFMLCGDAGAPPDALWRRTSGTTGAFTMTSLDVRGTYHPIVGRFSRAGDARDDILWVGYEPQYRSQPLDGPDHLWEGRADGRFTSSNESFPGAPLPIELGHAGSDRVLLLGLFGDGTTAWHDTATGSGLEPTNADDGFHLVSGFTQLATGRFTNPDRDDLLIDDVVLLHPTS